MRRTLAAATAALLLTVAACSDDSTDAPEDEASPTAEESAPTDGAPEGEMPTPPAADLEGVPEVVAEVEGVEITLDEFTQVYEGQLQQAFMQSQTAGQEVDQDALKQQTAEGMVDTELLLLEADNRSIAPSEDEVNAAAEELATSSGLGSADELFTTLEEQGLSREQAMSELEQQTAVEQLVTDEAGEFSASEEELRELYDQAMAAQGGGGAEGAEPPAFEDVRPQLEEQLRAQHEGQAVQGLLEQLRESADITYHL